MAPSSILHVVLLQCARFIHEVSVDVRCISYVCRCSIYLSVDKTRPIYRWENNWWFCNNNTPRRMIENMALWGYVKPGLCCVDSVMHSYPPVYCRHVGWNVTVTHAGFAGNPRKLALNGPRVKTLVEAIYKLCSRASLVNEITNIDSIVPETPGNRLYSPRWAQQYTRICVHVRNTGWWDHLI